MKELLQTLSDWGPDAPDDSAAKAIARALQGTIPVVHIPNVRISGSPWGDSDISSVIPLNREYNEKALEISERGRASPQIDGGGRWRGGPRD